MLYDQLSARILYEFIRRILKYVKISETITKNLSEMNIFVFKILKSYLLSLF